MKKLIFIRYGELSTKGDNINYFIKVLKDNIKDKLVAFACEIISDRARTYIIPKEKDFNDVLDKLKEVFGIIKIGLGYEIASDIKVISDTALELLKKESFTTFKVSCKRADKNFALTSMEIAREVGAYILSNIQDIKVDVHEPDITLNIEVRKDKTILFFEEMTGLGGYPVGIQGKGLLLLSGGIDSPVAGYLSLKRGIALECIYFEALPHTSIEARNKVITLVEKLTKYKSHIKLHIVPFTEIQEAIYKECQESYMITIMRRMMYRIGEELALKNKDLILINGESIGQVASQTLESIGVVEAVTKIPIIRPVACLDKLEIIGLAKAIDTYETSILPYEDCCTVFVPKHPVISPKEEICLKEEEKFAYQSLIEKAIKDIKTITIEGDEKHHLL